jgi:hypothetical protein
MKHHALFMFALIASATPLVSAQATRPATAPSTAPATAPAASAEQVKSLVADLAADDWSRREQAEDALVALGAAAVPAIKHEADIAQDIDLKERLQSALSRIEREQTLAPTMVTIDKEFDHPIEMFKALAAQVNLAVECDSEDTETLAEAETPLKLTVKNEPWLVALNRAMVETGVSARVEEGRLVLNQQGRVAADRPMHAAGSLLMVAESARRKSSVMLNGVNAGAAQASINLSIYSEPKTRFRGNGPYVLIKKLVDADGNSMVANAQDRIMFSRAGVGRSVGVVNVAPSKGKRVALLEGELIGEVVSRTTELTIDNLKKLPQSLTGPTGGEVTFDDLEPIPNGGWRLQAKPDLSNGAPTGVAAEISTSVSNQLLRVLDQNQKPMNCTIKPTTDAARRGGLVNGFDVTVTITSTDPDAQPTKLVWVVPVQSREVKIPVTLRDMPLP